VGPDNRGVTRAWTTIDTVDTVDGHLELRRRGEQDFLITLAGRVLMNSRTSRSEAALGELTAIAAARAECPRVLIGGLGMGCTLRAALDALPAHAEVVVAELHEAVVRWCQGELAALTGEATADARVTIELVDVAERIAQAGRESERFDAIALDLYEGPHAQRGADADPLFGRVALANAHGALREQGVLAVWSEGRDGAFEKRLRASGFSFEVRRPGRGGLRHAVYLARVGR
jgi:spermidine synthase